jgi:hypothetical protein
MNVCQVGHPAFGLGLGRAPALLAFAADAGPFAALSGQDIGVTSVGVAPAQVLLELAGQHRVVAVIRAAQDEMRSPEAGQAVYAAPRPRRGPAG